jgi:oxygen-independent coproporphyrinogen-3 oxidase
MLREVERRKNYFAPAKSFFFGARQATLYIGGGTPSLLPPDTLNTLIQKAIETFCAVPPLEFTVELNPDDVTTEYLHRLRDMGVNRISIGIQSFFGDDLQRLNRRHTAQQAVSSVLMAQKAGFENISVDLMYGLPGMDAKRWRSNLEAALSLGVQHLSAYALTIEKRTPFGVLQRKNKLLLPPEDELVMQHDLLCEVSAKSGFVHYEISNFALNGFFSKHNAAYWQQQPYIGIGPSAHSYNGRQRQSNVASNAQYIKNMEEEGDFFEVENLSQVERYNEYVFTGLRTIWGISLSYLQQIFDKELINYLLNNAKKHIDSKNIVVDGDRLTIPENRWFVADSIIVDLIWA